MISKNAALLALALCGAANAFTTPTHRETLTPMKVSSSIPPEWQGSDYDPDRRVPLPPVAGSPEAGGLSLGKKDVMIPEDYTMAKNVLAISFGLLAMYPSKFTACLTDNLVVFLRVYSFGLSSAWRLSSAHECIEGG